MPLFLSFTKHARRNDGLEVESKIRHKLAISRWHGAENTAMKLVDRSNFFEKKTKGQILNNKHGKRVLHTRSSVALYGFNSLIYIQAPPITRIRGIQM